MKRLLLLALVALLAAPPALAQDRGWGRTQGQKQSFGPRERESRENMRRERMEQRREERREQRFTPEEREKLRQDLLDANRDIRRRR